MDERRLALLTELERKVLWLACWTIHHANHVRPKADALKVGGHQASSASMVSIMTALYFAMLRPQDRVAVKPHAAPPWKVSAEYSELGQWSIHSRNRVPPDSANAAR